MDKKRKKQYQYILKKVQNSPMKTISFEGNVYHFKLDYKLPFGECHYARIFAKLFFYKELLGVIKPGDTLLETTSGSGGRAAAAIAKELGYKIVIAIPSGGEKARERAIVNLGADLRFTPKKDYVNGFPLFIKKFLINNRGTKYLNHMMGDINGRGSCINTLVINAFKTFNDEVLQQGINPDYIISPLGNGTNTLGLIDFKKIGNSKIVGFESVIAAMSYREKFPGKYENTFKVNDPSVFGRHDLPGSSPTMAIFPKPALDETIHFLDEVILVTSQRINKKFKKKMGYFPMEKSSWVAQWDTYKNLDFLSEFGRTGVAGFAAAHKLAQKQDLKGKSFLIPVFDAAWHYDDYLKK